MGSTDRLESVFEGFVRDVRGLFGEDAVAVIVYGSAVTEEYLPGKSDINFLVALTDAGIRRIGIVQDKIRSWQKQRIGLPLFMTKEYIHASLDSFPIEFLNIRSAYRVLFGEDVLKEITFSKADLRLQCERELKGKLLQLRQGFVQTRGKARALKRLIAESVVAFASIFRALLFLKDRDVPASKTEVFLNGCREFDLEEGLFSVLLSVKRFEAKLTKMQLESNVKRYIDQIAALSRTVDTMKFK